MIGPVLGGVPRLNITATNTNVVLAGNSLTAGVGGVPYSTLLKPMAPISNLFTPKRVAQAGRTTAQMTADAANIDAAWEEGKANILVAWEGTNSIANVNRTAQQAANDMAAFFTRCQSARRWITVVLTCLPRQATMQTATDSLNAKLDEYNAILRANYRGLGARSLIDVRRAGSPFNIGDYQMQSFEDLAANSGLWAPNETGAHIHLNTNGYTVIAGWVADALKRLPAR